MPEYRYTKRECGCGKRTQRTDCRENEHCLWPRTVTIRSSSVGFQLIITALLLIQSTKPRYILKSIMTMGTCGSKVSCEKQFNKVTIEVNPDIVGIGVRLPGFSPTKVAQLTPLQILVAFLLTAVAASVSIFYGYFMDMLPEPPDRYLSWVDHGFLRRFTWCRYCRATSKIEETIADVQYKPCSHTISKNKTKRC